MSNPTPGTPVTGQTEPVISPVQPDTPSGNVDPSTAAAATDSTESTVGMGTTIALGCVAGTVVLILVGLLIVGISALF